MILFFHLAPKSIYSVQCTKKLSSLDIEKLTWLFGNATLLPEKQLEGYFIGPKANMTSPWSTNAVEIVENMGIQGIKRIEKFTQSAANTSFDNMVCQQYNGLHQDIYSSNIEISPILEIEDIHSFNIDEGLALSDEEIQYLQNLSNKLNRPLTDSEVFGFSQINSEHCRHKIFNGSFIIDGIKMPFSLFELIKKTTASNINQVISAYKDNVAFIQGPIIEQFAPENPLQPSYYKTSLTNSVISLKAETHNFPTTVEPFNGAATGSGGEIRDRMAGGKGSIPLAGTALYMTPYSRLTDQKPWEQKVDQRKWLYQKPIDILIKASNGASDFGNKFGQPLINGALLTFEHQHEDNSITAYDKVVMLAGGVGIGKFSDSKKDKPCKGDEVIVMGGDNYRIGMGGAAVSSADTGNFNTGIELNAIQRSNPEMQKRVANTIRAMVESDQNPILSIHDHGAGGHLNCLSELLEQTGGTIDLDQLPIGDPTLSAKEIIGNESQERMGLIIDSKAKLILEQIAKREQAPIYGVGIVEDNQHFKIHSKKNSTYPIDVNLQDFFGNSPKTVLKDSVIQKEFEPISYDIHKVEHYLAQILRLESVACKDWLTNKVDRCVGGLVATQQCIGQLQLPLNNCGVVSLDFNGQTGIATAMGNAPIPMLISAQKGAKIAIAEALTNIIWAELPQGLKSVSLSANWMWPCKNIGEDARLYEAVEATSKFAIDLGINIPTGKDSLSMAQKYKDITVLSPGTVVISAVSQCEDIRKTIEPLIQKNGGSLYYIDLSSHKKELGGSSFAQILGLIGTNTFDIKDAEYFKNTFEVIQKCIKNQLILAGHDISSGGLITTLLELCFANNGIGANIDLSMIESADIIHLLFSENCGIVIQSNGDEKLERALNKDKIHYHKIGQVVDNEMLSIQSRHGNYKFSIRKYRDIWFETSYLLDKYQTGADLAKLRYDNYKNQPLKYQFPNNFNGHLPNINVGKKPIAVIVRDKGSNSEREMANALYRTGWEVRDVHMTDLMHGREDLRNVKFLGAVGGFSNSDVLGSAKGWAGAFKYNENARKSLNSFFEREDTLSVGICNGCQLFLELDLFNPDNQSPSRMKINDSNKHESNFTSVIIQKNNSVMLSSLEGCKLGVWISHGEGKFSLPLEENRYNIVAKYGYQQYPANPNGSDYNTAMLADKNGRHLVTMPHIERSFFSWNWAYYPPDLKHEISPWALAFLNARKWI